MGNQSITPKMAEPHRTLSKKQKQKPKTKQIKVTPLKLQDTESEIFQLQNKYLKNLNRTSLESNSHQGVIEFLGADNAARIKS